MNARDFDRIMREEELPITHMVRFWIDEAKKAQKIILQAKKEAAEGEMFWTDQDETIKKYTELKTRYIQQALDMARWAKENKDLNSWYELQNKRINGGI